MIFIMKLAGPHAEEIPQHAEQTAQHGEETPQHAEQTPQHGEQTLQHAEEPPHHGEQTTPHAEQRPLTSNHAPHYKHLFPKFPTIQKGTEGVELEYR